MPPNDEDCLRHIRELLTFLPQNNLDGVPQSATKDSDERADKELDSLIPTESNKPYDMKDVIRRVVDDGYFFEVAEHFAQNIVIGFARMVGRDRSALWRINPRISPVVWISIPRPKARALCVFAMRFRFRS